MVALSTFNLWFHFFYHGSVCTKSSADGCGSFRVSRRHECDRAVELRGEISHLSLKMNASVAVVAEHEAKHGFV